MAPVTWMDSAVEQPSGIYRKLSEVAVSRATLDVFDGDSLCGSSWVFEDPEGGRRATNSEKFL